MKPPYRADSAALRDRPAGMAVTLHTCRGNFKSAWVAEAAKFVPLEDLGLSPQCGFSSTHHGNALSQDDQWRKLELIVGVAREVWGAG